MRLELRIDLRRLAPGAALCTVIALLIPAAALRAEEPITAQSATVADCADRYGDSSSHNSNGDTSAATGQATTVERTTVTTTEIRQLAAAVLSIPADVASVNDISLDDQVLSRQRGGAVGMLMVAATPQLTRTNSSSVTLWDEIAPPSPLPIPVDAARAAQGNVASYQRK